MKIKFIAPKYGVIKATIQRNGRLGFSSQAADELRLRDNGYIRIGVNEEDEEDNNLYMIVSNDSGSDAFKVCRAGQYYYLNTKHLFNELDVDYINQKFIYDIVGATYEGKDMYKLIRRVRDRK